jgi:hypothetical protein
LVYFVIKSDNLAKGVIVGDLKKFLPGMVLGLLFIGAFCYGVGNLNAEPEKPTPAVQNTEAFGFITNLKLKAQEITGTLQQNGKSASSSTLAHNNITDQANITVIVDSGVKSDNKAGSGKGQD